MRVVPYRVKFEADVENAQGSYTLSRPTEEMLPVPISEDGSCYEVHTHDRGDEDEQRPFFYQIAFRIEDPSPYRLEDLTLSLDSYMYRDPSKLHDNNLICMQDRRNTADNLWYQPSRYKREKGSWKIITDGKDKSLPVNCITASGVFRVIVIANGSVVSEEPWVYILPSSISKDDYIEMLNDLVDLHERLITSSSSSVGLGQHSSIDYEKNHLRAETETLSNLANAVKKIMNLQSEQLGKRYTKTNIQKLRHFDSRVVKDYIRYGCSGKVMGIEYYEDHNTYENRVIKYVLNQIVKKYSKQKISMLTSENIDALVEEDFEQNILSGKNKRKDKDIESNVEKIKAAIRAKLEEETALNKLHIDLINAVDELCNLLKNDWFESIDQIHTLNSIELTPKFVCNPHYMVAYDLIKKILFEHPRLDFDSNSFGVHSTELVYEYWVFYKMLYHLQTLGFSIKNKETLIEHFSAFLDNLSNQGKAREYRIYASRTINNELFEIEFGNERKFAGNNLKLTPDYYLKTSHKKKRIEDRNYWYFFDAKYNSFSASDEKKKNYNQMIYDTACVKYIARMTSIMDSNPQEFGTSNVVGGSFLIMADCDDSQLQLTENGRLFGGSESIFKKKIVISDELPNGENIDNDNGLPAHRYGAIQLTPNHDSEMKLMFQMLFEYLDSERHGNGINLNACWNCGAEYVNKIEKDTKTKKSKKYYTTCPQCRDFRIETRCKHKNCHHLIVKHATINYHQKDPKDSSRWAILCPACARSIVEES